MPLGFLLPANGTTLSKTNCAAIALNLHHQDLLALDETPREGGGSSTLDR